MHDLIELAKDVKGLMEQWSDIGESRDRLRALQTRANQIHKVRELIDDLKDARVILMRAGVELRKGPSASRQLIKKCQKVREGFEKDWEKTARDKTLNPYFIDPVKAHVENKIDRELKQDWSEFIDRLSPPISNRWLNGLPDNGPIGDAKGKATIHFEELRKLRSVLPNEVDTVERVREITEQAKDIFSELDEIPEPVRSFLASASTTGAKMDDLTKEVRAWLTKNEMIERLRIRFG